MLEKAVQMPDDLGLVSRLLKGERKAQYELFQRYSKAMYNTSFRIVKDTGIAEDVIQESFLDVFRKIQSFRGDSTIGAWIKRIVVNKSLNQVNRTKWDFDTVESLPEPEIEDEQNDYSVLKASQLSQVIENLPDGFRTIFSLYLLEGYDHQEISDILGISVSTSKSQYKRAKDRVREELNKKLRTHAR